MRTLAALALAALAPIAVLPVALAQDQAPEIVTVEEPDTEVAFPLELQVAKDTRHQLCGMGVRVKKKFLMNFKVYALGFYLDEAAALPALREAAGDLNLKKLQSSEAFRKALLAGDKKGFGRSIRLVMVRDVDADTMAEAFEDSLWPRMKDATETTEERTAAKAALDRFRGFFEKEAEEDQVMDFTWLPGDKLQATVDGKRFPLVESEHLCRALFDVYLGEDPISKKAKTNIFTSLYAKLHPQGAEER